MDINLKLFEIIHSLAGKFWALDWLIVFLANYLPVIIIFLAIYLFIREKDWHRRWYFIFLAILAVILSRGIFTEVIHFFYQHPRPLKILDIHPLFFENSNSFPSGHATMLFALATVVFFLNRRWGTFFLVTSAIIVLARVCSGVHWPADILAGAAIGVLSAVFAKLLIDFKGFSSLTGIFKK